MKYAEITVRCQSEESEPIADVLYTVTKQPVAIYDKNDLIGLEFEYFEQSIADAMPNECLVKGYCSCQQIENIVGQIKENCKAVFHREFSCEVRIFDDEEYLNAWKQYFVPIEMGQLIIEPAWLSSGKPNAVLIETCMAFGTGQHATTASCINALEQIDCKNKTVLDVGCGSGILSLCAIKLGASNALAVDYDDEAVSTARQNARLNNVSDKVKVLQSNLLEQCHGVFDIVIANITSNILKLLYGQIDKVVSVGSYVVLSGIAEGQQDEIKQLYADKLKLKGCIELEDWHTLIFVKE